MSSDLTGLYEAGLCSVGPPVAAEVPPVQSAGLVMNGHTRCGAPGANRRFLERKGAVTAKDLRFQETLVPARRLMKTATQGPKDLLRYRGYIVAVADKPARTPTRV